MHQDTNTKQSSHLKKLDKVLSVKTIKLFDKKAEHNKNPVVRAHHVWGIVSEQLRDILGNEIFVQWFADIRPLVISDNVLILKTNNNLAGLWINQHYQKLVDLLLQFVDKKLSSFFLAPCDNMPFSSLESAAPEINSSCEN